MDRAFATLEVKSVDDDRRVITGIASTPTPDRSGDIMEPLGAQFTNPLPLLLLHDQRSPVGTVTLDPPTAAGITFTASLPVIREPGRVKDRVDEAWQNIKAGLMRGISVGFRPVEGFVQPIRGGGLHIYKWILGELSLVSVPANLEATILTVKSAAVGHNMPRDGGALRVGARMTIAEQNTHWANQRAAKAAAMVAIMTKAADAGVTLDDAQTQEYDGLASEVQSIDKHLERLRDQERLQLVQATRIEPVTGQKAAGDLRGALPVLTIKPNVPPGTAFIRMVKAIGAGRGDYMRTMEFAKQWSDTTPEVELMVKAAVAAGTTTDPTWAGPLVQQQHLVDEFLALLRPATLLGRVPGLRKVPFNVGVPSQTGGGTYAWVGQGLPKPVTKAQFGMIAVGFAKAAGIIVLTEELVKLSNPSAEDTVRQEMIAGIGQFLDGQFIDPAVAAVANLNPASITNGAPTAAATGSTGAAAKVDLGLAIKSLTSGEIPMDGAVWIMNDANAFGLMSAQNALGQPLFPGVTLDGGTLYGKPVVVTNTASTNVILVHAPSILFADDGGVRVDLSREASVQMDSAPANPADATTVLVSLWQNNLVGLRAERMVNWVRARTKAVYVITAANYSGA